MTPARARTVLLFMAACLAPAAAALTVGARGAAVLDAVALAWACGALVQLGRIDARRLRIDPLWLCLLAGAGVLWQAAPFGPDAAQGLWRALAGAGAGFLAGAVPIAAAEALGRRWPLQPGDALLFAALGCLLGPRGLVWALPVGAACALARHACVQRRRGRSCLRGHAPLGPGMAAGAGAALAAPPLGLADIGFG